VDRAVSNNLKGYMSAMKTRKKNACVPDDPSGVKLDIKDVARVASFEFPDHSVAVEW